MNPLWWVDGAAVGQSGATRWRGGEWFRVKPLGREWFNVKPIWSWRFNVKPSWAYGL